MGAAAAGVATELDGAAARSSAGAVVPLAAGAFGSDERWAHAVKPAKIQIPLAKRATFIVISCSGSASRGPIGLDVSGPEKAHLQGVATM